MFFKRGCRQWWIAGYYSRWKINLAPLLDYFVDLLQTRQQIQSERRRDWPDQWKRDETYIFTTVFFFNERWYLCLPSTMSSCKSSGYWTYWAYEFQIANDDHWGHSRCDAIERRGWLESDNCWLDSIYIGQSWRVLRCGISRQYNWYICDDLIWGQIFVDWHAHRWRTV